MTPCLVGGTGVSTITGRMLGKRRRSINYTNKDNSFFENLSLQE